MGHCLTVLEDHDAHAREGSESEDVELEVPSWLFNPAGGKDIVTWPRLEPIENEVLSSDGDGVMRLRGGGLSSNVRSDSEASMPSDNESRSRGHRRKQEKSGSPRHRHNISSSLESSRGHSRSYHNGSGSDSSSRFRPRVSRGSISSSPVERSRGRSSTSSSGSSSESTSRFQERLTRDSANSSRVGRSRAVHLHRLMTQARRYLRAPGDGHREAASHLRLLGAQLRLPAAA